MSNPIETEATGACNTHEDDDPELWATCQWCDNEIYMGNTAYEYDGEYFCSIDCCQKWAVDNLEYNRITAGEND